MTAGLVSLTAGAAGEETDHFKGSIVEDTGRGDFDHGLDLVFRDRPCVDVVEVPMAAW